MIFFPLIATALFLKAHPGIGLVKDSKGNIFYTDLQHVWKIRKDGSKIIGVKNVHTHELYIDKHDQLYGEHLWYNGEAADTWGHYVWKLSPGGNLDTVKKPAAGFLQDYSFVRDGKGNMYTVQRFKRSTIRRIDTEGKSTIIAEGDFKDIRWMHVMNDGTLYFVDVTSLYKIKNDSLLLVAKNLESRSSVFEYGSLKHNVYGIWADNNGNVYAAILGGQVVKKISRDGEVSDLLYTQDPWKPVSGITDNDDGLWLMEVNDQNHVRVRRILKSELLASNHALFNVSNKSKPLMIISLLTITILFILWSMAKKMLSWYYSSDKTVKLVENASE